MEFTHQQCCILWFSILLVTIIAYIIYVINYNGMTSPMSVMIGSKGSNALFQDYEEIPEGAGTQGNWMYQPPEIDTRILPYFPDNKLAHMGKKVPVNCNTCYKGDNPWMPPEYPPTYAMVDV